MGLGGSVAGWWLGGWLVESWLLSPSPSLCCQITHTSLHFGQLPTGHPNPILRLPVSPVSPLPAPCSIARPHPNPHHRSTLGTWTLPLLPTLLFCFVLYSISSLLSAQLRSAQRAADALVPTIAAEVHSQTSNSRTTRTRLEPQLRGRESYASRRTKSFSCQTFFTFPSSKSPLRIPNCIFQEWTPAHRP